jgi:hypothetical protein
VGVAEEMRFVAMRLRNPKKTTLRDNTGAAEDDESEDEDQEVKEGEGADLRLRADAATQRRGWI